MKTDRERPEMPTSQWSLIAAAQGATTTRRRLALSELLRLYYPALRAHLVLRMRLDAATADDFLQGFIADKILDRELLTTANPDKGRFRSLLLRSLTNYSIDMLRRQQLRATQGFADSADGSCLAYEPAKEMPADPFEVAWAREVLVRALHSMQAECEAQGVPERWLLFERRVLIPVFRDEEPPAYRRLVDEFGFASPQQASNALITAKRHFQRLLCQVVGEYAESDEDCAREVTELLAIVQAAGPLHIELAQLPGAQRSDSSAACEKSAAWARELALLFLAENSSDSAWEPGDYAAIWMHLLDQPLLRVIERAIELPHGTTAHDAVNVEKGTVGELLCQPLPSVESLVAVKETARGYARVTANEMPGEIATALYFTSIAAALVRRHVRISKSDDTILNHGFERLATRPWLDASTLDLVRDAARIIAASGGDEARSPSA